MIENCLYKKKQLAAGQPVCDTLLSYGLVKSYAIVTVTYHVINVHPQTYQGKRYKS
jgi:hypothetical protein